MMAPRSKQDSFIQIKITSQGTNSRSSDNDVLRMDEAREKNEHQGNREVVGLVVKQIRNNSVVPLLQIVNGRHMKSTG